MNKAKTSWWDIARIVIGVVVLFSPFVVFASAMGCLALSWLGVVDRQTAINLLWCSIGMFVFWIPVRFLVGLLLFKTSPEESGPRDYDQGEEEERRAYRHP
jgi:hypothetical protein